MWTGRVSFCLHSDSRERQDVWNRAQVYAMEEQEGTFLLWGYRFRGTYASPSGLASMPGVYVIWCETKTSWKVVDADESDDLRHNVTHHSRKACWKRACRKGLRYAAYYTPGLSQTERESIVRRIRKIGKPPCGGEKPLNTSRRARPPASETHDHDGGHCNAQRQM